MAKKVLVDTDILIDITKGKREAAEFFEGLGEVSISAISAMELVAGAKNFREVEAIEDFIGELFIEVLTEKIKVNAHQLLREHDYLCLASSYLQKKGFYNPPCAMAG